MIDKSWEYQQYEGFSIDPCNPEDDKFDVDVEYWDWSGCEGFKSVDALVLYKALKDYFKGTKYE